MECYAKGSPKALACGKPKEAREGMRDKVEGVGNAEISVTSDLKYLLRRVRNQPPFLERQSSNYNCVGFLLIHLKQRETWAFQWKKI